MKATWATNHISKGTRLQNVDIMRDITLTLPKTNVNGSFLLRDEVCEQEHKQTRIILLKLGCTEEY